MAPTTLNTSDFKLDLHEIPESILLIELQPLQANFAWIHQKENKLLQLQQLRLEKDRMASFQSLTEWFGQLDPVWNQAKQVVFILNFPGFSLLPIDKASDSLGEKLLELTNGYTNRESILSDKVNGWNVQNFYRMPTDWMPMIEKNWSGASVFHYSSLFLETTTTESGIENGFLRVVFFQSYFLVVVLKSRKLQLLQTYEYQHPEDISYFLLSICKQIGLDQESVLVQLAGMIDPDSALYTELQKYFLQLEWDSVKMAHLPSNLPEHYFSPLLRMATCV